MRFRIGEVDSKKPPDWEEDWGTQIRHVTF